MDLSGVFKFLERERESEKTLAASDWPPGDPIAPHIISQ